MINKLNRIFSERELPATIKVDNAGEFISKVMGGQAQERSAGLDFSPPGQPDRQRHGGKL